LFTSNFKKIFAPLRGEKRKKLKKGNSLTSILDAAKTNKMAPAGRIVPVAIGAAQVAWIDGPRPAPQHPLAG
jgi:hypothetical protein